MSPPGHQEEEVDVPCPGPLHFSHIADYDFCPQTGLCSNAFATENAAFAFDCPVMDAFALAFDCPVMDAFASSAFALAFDSNALFLIESNATVLLLFYNVYFLSWFFLE